MPLRCLLVDDNDAFLETARALLERQGVQVAGVASNIAGALRQARALRPDVVLVDIGLGEESGFELARLLAADGPRLWPDRDTPVHWMDAGAIGDTRVSVKADVRNAQVCGSISRGT
jgi:DNA-binding NarL/FixJ family response regulator